MKQRIRLGAYGWRYDHWGSTFYPEDLPTEKGDDWRLAYYSNEFDCVLVPASYWSSDQEVDCQAWLDDVHEGFQFYVECRESMLEHVSQGELTRQLQSLQPQLSGLIFLDERFSHASTEQQFGSLVCSLDVEVFSVVENFKPASKPVSPVWRTDQPLKANLALVDDNLSDMRKARALVGDFVASSANGSEIHEKDLIMLACHPRLRASDLSHFQSVIHLMGH